MSEEKKDLKIKLKDDKGKYYEVISTEQFNIQEELNKEIEINIKYKEVLDKIKEKCLSIKGNPEHTIVSKNELVKQFLELLEEIDE